MDTLAPSLISFSHMIDFGVSLKAHDPLGPNLPHSLNFKHSNSGRNSQVLKIGPLEASTQSWELHPALLHPLGVGVGVGIGSGIGTGG